MSIMATSLLNQLSLSNNNYKLPINHCSMAVLSLSSSADYVQSQSSLLQFRFDDFLQKCSASPSTSSSSPQEEILADSVAIDEGGSKWRLSLLRKNDVRLNENEHHVTVSMVLVKETKCRRLNDETTTFCFMIKDLLDNIVYEETFQYSISKEEEEYNDNTTTSTGFMKSFNMREFKVDDLILLDGALTIDVAVHVVVASKTRTAQSQTTQSQSLERSSLCYNNSNNPFRMNMLNLLHSGTNADVAFDTNGTITLAHKFIIDANASALARLYDGRSAHSTLNNPVTIVNTSAEAFRYLLHYIYGGRAPGTSDMLSLGKDLIAISYRFQVLSLKDEVERALIKQCVVDSSNCIDFIFFANKYDCLLLTRHAISYFIAHSQELLDSESSKRLQQYPQLMHAIMFQMADRSNNNENKGHIMEKQTQRAGFGERFKSTLKGLMSKSDKHKLSLIRGNKKKKSQRRQVSSSSTSSVVQSKEIRSYDDDTTTLVPTEGEELTSEEVRKDAWRVLKAADDKHRSRLRRIRRSAFRRRSSSEVGRKGSTSSFSNNILLRQTMSRSGRRSSALRLSTSRRRRRSSSNSTLLQHTSRYLQMHGSDGWIKS